MRFDLEAVRHVATLARLQLSKEEEELFAGQLSAIIDYFDQLQELDTEGVEATAYAVPLTNVMRPDQPGPSLPPPVVLANAPETAEGQFKVPRVLE